jgi:benzodiazapine receptor
MKIALNWIFFLSVILINALANILPINGYNTGQVSEFYPNYFVPAGFTFSIWGIIYLLLFTYTIAFTYYNIKSNKFPNVKPYLNKVTPLFLVTCILNISWIFAWHYLQVELSVVIMLFFLAALCKIFIEANKFAEVLTPTQSFLLITPFTVYLAWISVATIANFTALFVKLSWNGFGMEPIYWSGLMILIAIALGLLFLFKYGAIGFTTVIAWALWGINARQGRVEIINICGNAGLLILLGAMVFFILRKLKKRIAQ